MESSRAGGDQPVAPPEAVGSDRLVPRSGSRAKRIGARVLADGFPIALVVIWWALAQRLPPFILPDPLDVGRQTLKMLFGDLAIHTYTSFFRVVIAVGLALLIGGFLVFLASLLPVTEPLIGSRVLPLLNGIPSLGWAIIGVTWFGVTDVSVIFVETAIVVPFCLVNLWEGVRSIDRGLLEMGKSFTRNKVKILVRIELPLLLPYVFAALRLSFSVAWKVALIAEFFGAQRGLGLLMNTARQNFDTPTLFATIVTVLVVVFLFERLIFEPVGTYFATKAGTGATR